MKKYITTTACILATAMIATAQVPSLINYQGRLTDAGGNPVTGSKNFAISIYDAASGGNLLYSETIGAVTLDANGVYSFQFGSTGTSNTQVMETVASTDGTAIAFEKVLDKNPVVAGSVSVTDGNYTWSQSTGSSNGGAFGAAYSTSLRLITVSYYGGVPAAGRTITASYRIGTTGITGALSSGVEHWMEISVDGTPQATRQKVLTVPFAINALNVKPIEFGDYVSRTESVVYQAPSSGFILATRIWPRNGGSWMSVFIGDSPETLQQVAADGGEYNDGCMTVPVSKGKFWKCPHADLLYFVPIVQ
jgi:hypothetical protein